MNKITKGTITSTSMIKSENNDSDIIIDKIVIKQLFGCTDYAFDFSKECMILIGPNGIGKSTAIKLVNALLKGDWHIIYACKYPFEKIEFYSRDVMIEAPYNEFFPDLKDLVDICASRMLSKIIHHDKIKVGKEAVEDTIKDEINSLRGQMVDSEWYATLANCYRDLTQLDRIQLLNKQYSNTLADKLGISLREMELDIVSGLAIAIKMYVPTTLEDGTTKVDKPFKLKCEDGSRLILPTPYFFIDQTALMLDTEDATIEDSIVIPTILG